MANEPVNLSRNPGARLGDVSSNDLDDIREVFSSRTVRSASSIPFETMGVEEKEDIPNPDAATPFGVYLPKVPNPVKVSKAKERKCQSPGQEWVNQIDTEMTNRLHKELPHTLYEICFVRCFMPRCKSIAQVNYTFRKDGPFFCHKCHTGAKEAPVPVSSALVVHPKAEIKHAEVLSSKVALVPQPVATELPLVMYGDLDYYEQVIPCAAPLPRKLDAYLACVDFLNIVQAYHPFSSVSCCCCISYLPCILVSESILPNGLAQVTSYCSSLYEKHFQRGLDVITGCFSSVWSKCIRVCVYDEPVCVPKYRAPRRHEQVRYDTSQSYLSSEFSLNAKSAIIIKYCLRDLFKFFTTRFIAQRFGSDDECRRALREAADDFPGKDRVDVAIRDVVYNDTIMHFIWHKRQAANARGFVLGGAKASPDHITLG